MPASRCARATPIEQRDPGLADEMLDAVMRQILTDAPEPAESGPMAATVAFRTIAPRLDMLSEAERQLLRDWLDRAMEALKGSGVQ